MITTKDTARIRRLLLQWYSRSARDLPWRVPNVSPYMVFISECMLQQTQADRVAQLLPRFLDLFPTIEHLSAATPAQVITAWKGLGYNSRALRLRDAARFIMNEFNGIIPSSESDLLRLPGIGTYTASAVACFAFGARTVVVDVNVRRVYSRLMHRMDSVSDLLPAADILRFAEQIIPRKNVATWHHAVMDLGAVLCKARNTKCHECPLQRECPSAFLRQTSKRSQKKSEPMLLGEPRRLWRGRLIQKLREAGPKGLTLRQLLPPTAAESRSLGQWKALLAMLERDGLIVLGKRIRLRDN